MQLHIVPADDVVLRKDSQRQNFKQESILELAASIDRVGLIHPLVIRLDENNEFTLVAGRRRLKALEHLWFLGAEVRCGERIVPENHVPCIYVGDIDILIAEEIELEENIQREDLTWQERADAVARLARLRTAQAQTNCLPAPTTATIAEEVSGSSEGQFQENVRQDIILGNALKDAGTAAAISTAKSRAEAFKLLKRHEETKKHTALGHAIGASFTSALHVLRQGDCLQIMPTLPEATFDVILTDPPYGIGADDFSDSGGKTAGGHFYDDSYDNWLRLAPVLATQSFALAKAQSHCYVFCDIDRFVELKAFFSTAGWKVFRTPFIWVNPTAMRAPWPEHGPQRKWQAILFATKGNRTVTRLYSDVLTYPSDPNLGHQAQKPVALYSDLLRRSVWPGNSVLDPFAGTGVVFPASHEHKCRAVGIERDAAAAGIASQRLEKLK